MSHVLRKDTIDPYGPFSGAFARTINKSLLGLMKGKGLTMCLKEFSNKTKTKFLELNGSMQLTNIEWLQSAKNIVFYV